MSVPGWALLGAVLLVPAICAFLEAAYLVLLARAVTQGDLNLRQNFPQVLRAVPGLFFIEVLWHLMYLLLPEMDMVFISLLWLTVYSLWPLVIAAGDLPLGPAFLEAPLALWSRIGSWLGLAWRVLLLTGLFTLA